MKITSWNICFAGQNAEILFKVDIDDIELIEVPRERLNSVL